MQPVVDWIVENWWRQPGTWWKDLGDGDQGTWFGGIATAVAVIIALGTALYQWRQSLKLRKAERKAALRSHAEKFSCWVAGRLISPVKNLPIPAGGLIVALINASAQPFTDAVLEVELRDGKGSASTHRFSISGLFHPAQAGSRSTTRANRRHFCRSGSSTTACAPGAGRPWERWKRTRKVRAGSKAKMRPMCGSTRAILTTWN